VSGIVGCGKPTFINHCLEALAENLEIFKFNGDESLFRQKIIDDSSYLLKVVKSKTGKKSLIFVDEVQKCEGIFDALI
jgi:predicted AAA+ superfamily ATPase